jgi:hypothetical protein
MVRDEDPARGKVVAAVPLVVRGVTENDTMCRPGCQLMRSSGGDVRVTGTPEDMKVIITGRGTKEGVVRSRSRGKQWKEGS